MFRKRFIEISCYMLPFSLSLLAMWFFMHLSYMESKMIVVMGRDGDNKFYLIFSFPPDILRSFHIPISFLKYSHIFIFRTEGFLVIKEKYVHAMLTVSRGVYKTTSSCKVYSYCSLVHSLIFTVLPNSLIMLSTGCVIMWTLLLSGVKLLPKALVLSEMKGVGFNTCQNHKSHCKAGKVRCTSRVLGNYHYKLMPRVTEGVTR